MKPNLVFNALIMKSERIRMEPKLRQNFVYNYYVKEISILKSVGNFYSKSKILSISVNKDHDEYQFKYVQTEFDLENQIFNASSSVLICSTHHLLLDILSNNDSTSS